MTSYTNRHSFPFAFADFLAFLTRLCELMLWDSATVTDLDSKANSESECPATLTVGPRALPVEHSWSRRRRKTSRARAAHGKYYVVDSPGGILGKVDLYSLGFLCYETLC
jgi:hypothetical protein